MPDNSEGYEHAARLTVDLVDHGNTPDQLSEAVLEKLVEMAAESKMNIWHRETGLSVASLTALYRLYETGAGYCHARIYADYELGLGSAFNSVGCFLDSDCSEISPSRNHSFDFPSCI
jgi:hypothetical protein